MSVNWCVWSTLTHSMALSTALHPLKVPMRCKLAAHCDQICMSALPMTKSATRLNHLMLRCSSARVSNSRRYMFIWLNKALSTRVIVRATYSGCRSLTVIASATDMTCLAISSVSASRAIGDSLKSAAGESKVRYKSLIRSAFSSAVDIEIAACGCCTRRRKSESPSDDLRWCRPCYLTRAMISIPLVCQLTDDDEHRDITTLTHFTTKAMNESYVLMRGRDGVC